MWLVKKSQKQEKTFPEILFVGRVNPEKGSEFLFKALKEIDTPLKVNIIGDGTSISTLKDMAKNARWAHEIYFAGWVDNDQLNQYYQRAALLVVPSVWPEPFGINGIEAMSYGVPSVAFDVGGISDWLRHEETGLLVPRLDINALSTAIVEITKNREKNIQFGKIARQIAAKEYGIDTHMKELISIFESAVKK